ncbi:hypothetical protein [Caldibacillus thermoamylovorans]|nr:hypothetical protein [Caldibacillus thermoamylovorans]
MAGSFSARIFGRDESIFADETYSRRQFCVRNFFWRRDSFSSSF